MEVRIGHSGEHARRMAPGLLLATLRPGRSTRRTAAQALSAGQLKVFPAQGRMKPHGAILAPVGGDRVVAWHGSEPESATHNLNILAVCLSRTLVELARHTTLRLPLPDHFKTPRIKEIVVSVGTYISSRNVPTNPETHPKGARNYKLRGLRLYLWRRRHRWLLRSRFPVKEAESDSLLDVIRIIHEFPEPDRVMSEAIAQLRR